MKYFLDALKKYAVFNGRASRKEYWMFFLFYLITYFALIIFSPVLEVAYIYILAILLPAFSITVRRLHDTNHSAWWLLFGQIPILNIVFFCFLVMDGNPDDNQYGSNPKRLLVDGEHEEQAVIKSTI